MECSKKHLSYRFAFATVVFAALLLSASLFPSVSSAQNEQKDGSPKESSDLEAVALQLKWMHQFQFAGYYAAKEKGFYARRGLDVEFLEGGSFDHADAVLSGKAQYGIASSEIVLERISGKPVVLLAAVFQHSAQVLIVRQNGEEIRGIHDLAGRKVKTPIATRSAELRAIFLHERIPLETIIFVEQKPPFDFADESISAFAAYTTNEPFWFVENDVAFSVIHPKSYGIDFYGDCIFTTENEIDNRPERADNFLKASLEGWRYALNHKEEIVDLIVEKYGCSHSRKRLLHEAREIEKLVRPDIVSIGHVNGNRWKFIAETYGKLGFCEKDFSIDGFVRDPAAEILKTREKRRKNEIVAAGLVFLSMLLFLAWNLSLKWEAQKRTKALSDELERGDKARKALLESERKFHAAFRSNPAVLAISTIEEGRFVDVNRAFFELTGFRREEVVGKKSADLNLWHDPTQRDRIIDEMKRTGFVNCIEVELVVQNGEIKTGLFSCGKIEIEGKELLLSHFIDITEQKKAEGSLRESERRFRIVADFAYDWEYWLGADGQLKFVSPSCERVTGYRPDDFAKNPDLLNSIVHEEDRERVATQTFLIDGKTKAPDTVDFRIVASDGTVKWINRNCRPVFARNGTYLGQRVSNRDITDRKLAENKLKESEAMFKTITEKNSDVTVILDQCGKVRYVSPSVTAALYYAPEEIVGKEFRRFLREDCQPVAMEIFESAVAIPMQTPPLVELTAVRKDGRPIHFEGFVTNMLDDPFIKGIVLNCRNVSERKKIEEELNQARKAEAAGRLAGSIAHDFNNILSSLMGYAELALDDAERGADPESNLKEVLNVGVRASELVKQILDFSSPTRENFSGSVKIGTVAEETTELLKAALPPSIRVEKKIESRLSVKGDPTQLHQVFMNLFTNAAQAMEAEGGVLEVLVEDIDLDPGSLEFENDLKPGRHVKATVSDTGEGIAPEVIGFIFQPYFTTKKEGDGTGMGLAVVRDIVGQYEGHVSVESEPGKKTVFTLFFPGVEEEAEIFEVAAEEIAFGREHILFIDDDAAIADMAGELLKRMGYQATVLSDSAEALALFRSAPDRFDMVVTDMTMPNLSGSKLALSMMEIRPDIPVVLCTGYSIRTIEERALESGVKAILKKPVVKRRLAKTIRDILDAQRKAIGRRV